MKKFLALLLSFMLVLSLAACGDTKEDTSDPEPSTKAKTEDVDSSSDDKDIETENEAAAGEVEVGDDLTNFLSQLSLVQPTDAIVGTGWEFSGGMIDGTEMNEEDAAQSLEVYGGKLNIIFDDDENVSMVQGGGTLKGVFGVTEDNENVLGLIFTDAAGSQVIYAGLLAEVDDTLVLMLFPDGSGKNAIYFTQISEQ